MNQTTKADIKILFGQRLERTRRMRGMSLRALAGSIGNIVSYNALHKYEQGEMLPDSTVLRALAKALGQTTDLFFRPFTVSLNAIAFRKKSGLGARAKASLREEAAEYFERYLEVEQALGLDVTFTNPLGDVVIRSGDDIEAAAVKLRAHWSLGLESIGNVVELLEQRQVKVFLLDADMAFDGFSGWSDGIPVIVLNRKHTTERLRLTAIHELAHIIFKFDESIPHKAIEKLCHRFAGAMLIPKATFEREFGGYRRTISVKELTDIKEDFGVSIAAIMARAHDLQLISDSGYKQFCILYNKWNWRAKEPGQYHGSEESTRFEQLLQRAVAKEALSITLAASLAKKPLFEFERGIKLVP